MGGGSPQVAKGCADPKPQLEACEETSALRAHLKGQSAQLCPHLTMLPVTPGSPEHRRTPTACTPTHFHKIAFHYFF